MAVTLYILYPFSLRNVEDLLFARGIDISYETVRYWWNSFDPIFAADIRRQRVSRMRGRRRCRPSGAGFKPLQAATVKSRGGERCSKSGPRVRQVPVPRLSTAERY